MKSKKFLAIIIIIFLVFSVAGKYSKSRSALSSNYVYATTVKDPKTGKKYRYEIQMTSGKKSKTKWNHSDAKKHKHSEVYTGPSQDRVRVCKRDATTGKKIYEEVCQGSVTKDKIFVVLKKEETKFIVKREPQFIPITQQQVNITVVSNQYQQVSNTSVAINANVINEKTDSSDSSDGSDSSSLISKTSSDDSNSDHSNIEKSSTTSSTKTESSTTESKTDTKDKSSEKTIEKAETKTDISNPLSLSKEDTEKVESDFGDWLYKSDFAKDAIVTRGKYEDNLHFDVDKATFLSAKTEDGDLLARFVGDFKEDITTTKGYLQNQEVSGKELIDYKNSFKLALLGTDLSSNDSDSYQSTGNFRVYTLKENQHHYYDTSADEYDNQIKDVLPEKEIEKDKNKGYDYYYEKLVDHSKDSYQILLANNGKVYFVSDYGITDDTSTEYQLADKEMQDAYQSILDKYTENKSKDSSSEKSSSKESSSSSSTDESSDNNSSSTSDSSESETDLSSGSDNVDISAIKSGDFSSFAGKWKNAKGDVMIIDDSGHVKTDQNSDDAPYINLKNANIENNVLYAAITFPNVQASGTVPIVLTPRGEKAPSKLFTDGDTTDVDKDRFFITQGILSSASLEGDVYYRVN